MLILIIVLYIILFVISPMLGLFAVAIDVASRLYVAERDEKERKRKSTSK